MAHRVAALLAATAAAPYLFLIAMSLAGPLAGGPLGFGDLRDLAGLLVVGGFGLALFGPPTFVLAGLMAFAFDRLGWRRQVHAVAGGTVLGAALASLFLVETLTLSWVYPLSGALAGALCGWLYRALLGRQDAEAVACGDAAAPREALALGGRRDAGML